jgi:hypothetical protein
VCENPVLAGPCRNQNARLASSGNRRTNGEPPKQKERPGGLNEPHLALPRAKPNQIKAIVVVPLAIT